MFYLGLYRENVVKIFLSNTTGHRALIFGMQHYQVDILPSLFKLYPWGQMFNLGLYRENVKKSSCLKPEGIDY